MFYFPTPSFTHFAAGSPATPKGVPKSEVDHFTKKQEGISFLLKQNNKMTRK